MERDGLATLRHAQDSFSARRTISEICFSARSGERGLSRCKFSSANGLRNSQQEAATSCWQRRQSKGNGRSCRRRRRTRTRSTPELRSSSLPLLLRRRLLEGASLLTLACNEDPPPDVCSFPAGGKWKARRAGERRLYPARNPAKLTSGGRAAESSSEGASSESALGTYVEKSAGSHRGLTRRVVPLSRVSQGVGRAKGRMGGRTRSAGGEEVTKESSLRGARVRRVEARRGRHTRNELV